MFNYMTGNLLISDAECLVNTVNCQGYMGKGIAYQFKLKFPKNNDDYVKACKKGELKIGKLHSFRENDKLIINFPTKDNWREKSKLQYIEKGLDELILLIKEEKIKSIAIPPLGSGNGGLIWSDVKKLINSKLSELANTVDIYIYEPSTSFAIRPEQEPQLNTSALVLMEIKNHLNSFSKLRLQKTAYFINIFMHKKYFKFEKYKFGPYSHSIEVISRSIKEFQDYHDTYDLNKLKKILHNKIISQEVEKKLLDIMPALIQSCDFINNIETDHELECLSTICFLIEDNSNLLNNENELIKKFKEWSLDKESRFSENEIAQGLNKLVQNHLVVENLLGFSLNIND